MTETTERVELCRTRGKVEIDSGSEINIVFKGSMILAVIQTATFQTQEGMNLFWPHPAKVICRMGSN